MKTLRLEVAESPVQLAQGLMGREKLDPDAGMLFKTEGSLTSGFWGKNTKIPLDIAFIDREGKIVDIKHITPMSTRIVHSGQPYSSAIEVNSGFFSKNDIECGHSVDIVQNDDTYEARFGC